MKKYVLTGGPSVGKTTVIELLAARGYAVVPEAARLIIEEERLKNSDILPFKNLKLFQQRVVEKQLELEAEAQGDVVFYDRGIVDGYAYCSVGNVAAPDIIREKGRGRYDKVFFLESLGQYVEDGVRSRKRENAALLHQKIYEAYVAFGYEPIIVPVLPPEERVKFILDALD